MGAQDFLEDTRKEEILIWLFHRYAGSSADVGLSPKDIQAVNETASTRFRLWD